MDEAELNNILEEALKVSFEKEEETQVDNESEDIDEEETEDITRFKDINSFINSNIKWIFVSGKGGVGKTTCSSALGIQYSKKFNLLDKKVLIVSTDPAHNLSDSFNQKFTDTPTKVDSFSNLFCMEYDNKKGIQKTQNEFMENINKSKTQNINMNDFNDVGSFFQNMPGIDEAFGFLSLTKEIKKMDYEVVIFDTAPTGHTSKLLSYPQLLKESYDKMINKPMGQMFQMFMTSSVQNGNNKIIQMIERLNDLNYKLCDPRHTTFICVGIPEFLSVYENERFIQQLFEMNINVSGIIINQLIEKKNCIDDFWKNRKQMQDKYTELIHSLYSSDFFITCSYLEDVEIRGNEKLTAFSNKLLENQQMLGPSFEREH